jgi:mono/diheme cytochrome c family protein
MKMIRYITAPLFVIALFSCESHTYEELQDGPITGTVTYEQHIKPIIEANCLSCHGSGGVSDFRPLGTYSELKAAVQTTNLLDRIQRQNGEPGQMPQSGRMPQSGVDAILAWNAQGLLEN